MIGFNGGLIGKERAASAGSTSGVWTLGEQSILKAAGKWPLAISESAVLHLRGNGTNNSTSIIDSGTYGLTMTAVGNTKISTAQSKFGGASILFGGSGDRITTSAPSAFAFGTEDFTVEAWLREGSRENYPAVIEIGNHAYNTGILFATRGNNGATIYSGAFYGTASVPALPNSDFYHIAYVRKSGSLRIYVNGTGNTAVSFTNNLSDISTVTVGSISNGSAGYSINGYMDDLKVSKRAAYDGNFTPPTDPS